MKRSTDRILTTHVGSLIRPPELLGVPARASRAGADTTRRAHAQCLKETVAEVVRQQAEVGVDVVSDGEFGKGISWSQYVLERLSGFERRPFSRAAIRSPRAPTASASPSSTPSSMRAITSRRSIRHGRGRADQVHRPGAAAAGHRQFQGGAEAA